MAASSIHYTVVEFLNEGGSAAIIPTTWLDESTMQCLWPEAHQIPPSKISKAVKACLHPSEEWTKCPVKVLYKTDQYLKACDALRQAEMYSDIQSEKEYHESLEKQSRKRRKPSRLLPSDSENDSCDDIVQPPPFKKQVATKRLRLLGAPSAPPPRKRLLEETTGTLSPPQPRKELRRSNACVPPTENLSEHESNPTPAWVESGGLSTHSEGNAREKPRSSIQHQPTVQSSTSSNHNHAYAYSLPADNIFPSPYYTSPGSSSGSLATTPVRNTGNVRCAPGPVVAALRKELNVFYEKMLTMTEDVKLRVAEANRKMDIILAGNLEATARKRAISEWPDAFPEIPFQTETNIKAFDNMLVEKRNIKIVMSYLSVLRGRDAAETTKLVLVALLDQRVMETMNWAGRNRRNTTTKKFAFKQFRNLTEVILRVVQASHTDANMHEVRKNIQETLKHAPKRIND